MTRAPDRFGLGPLALYLGLALLYFGRSLAGHGADRYIGVGPDPSQFMWYLRWWPYALAHHVNPFIAPVIWAPTGVNIAWTASIPLPSLVAWPLTAWFGLIPAYNVLCLLCPILAGWSAFLLCRMVTRNYWPAVFGGLIFGFSAHMLGKTLGNLNDALVFPIPLAACLGLMRFNDRVSTRRFVILLAGLLITAFLCFIELFATMTMVAGITLVLAIAFAPAETRPRVIALIPPIILSYALTLLILSPYLYFLLTGRSPEGEIMPVSTFSIDLLNLVIPTPLNQLGRIMAMRHLASWFKCGLMESGGYLTPPLIIIAVLFARRHLGEPEGRLLISLLLLMVVFALGPHLQVMGRATPLALPWLVITKLPFIQKALPARLMLYAFLALAVIAARWLSESSLRPAAKLAWVTITAVFMLPNLSARFWTTAADIPEFFTAGLYRHYLAPGERVIVMPYSIDGDAMLWQAETNMYFNMVEGWTGFPLSPKTFGDWPMVGSLVATAGLPDAGTQLKVFLASHDISTIIVAEDCTCEWEFYGRELQTSGWLRTALSPRDRQLWRSWFATLGVAPVTVGGVQLYRVPLAQLAPYKALTLVQMQAADSRQRFETLVVAGARYLAEGHRPAALTPMRALKLSLLPAEWFSDNYQVRDVEDRLVLNSMLLAPWEHGDIAVGVTASYAALKPVIEQYGPEATLVRYFILGLPPRYADKPTGEGSLLLLMTFKPATLARLAAQIVASHHAAAMPLASGPSALSHGIAHDALGKAPAVVPRS